MTGHGSGQQPEATGDIGVMTLPPLPGGVLTAAQVAALDAALDAAQGLPGIVVEIAGSTPGPADPAALVVPEGLAALVERVAQWPVPVVALLQGAVAGPVASLALAARARVALGESAMRWPEADAALLPAAGAVVRLVRLAGAAQAFAIAGGAQVLAAAEAHAAGLVDALAADIETARRQARALIATPPPRDPPDGAATFDAVQQARRNLASGPAEPVAPARLADCIEAAALLPLPQALAFAAEAEADALADPVGCALRHLLCAEQALVPALTRTDADGTLTLTPAAMEAAGALRAAWVIAARALVSGGVSPESVDAAARDWGHDEGPLGSAPPPRADAGITTRLLAALLAESGRLVTGGALETPLQADALAVMATGFPRWRGGPVLASIRAGQALLARRMQQWAGDDPVWQLPDPVAHAILVTGHWGHEAWPDQGLPHP